MNLKVSNTAPVPMTGINIKSARRHITKTQDIFAPSMPEIMDNAIDTFVNKTSKMNIMAGVRFHKLLAECLPEIMTPENFINSGCYSNVYKISDNYVAKIKRGYSSKNALSAFDWTRVPGRKFGQINIYCGEPLVRCRNVEILRNAVSSKKSMPCGLPYNKMKDPREYEKYYNTYLPECSSLPQSSYDEFALNLKKLNEMKGGKDVMGREMFYTPDVMNPNNVLISDGKFKLVDQLEETPVKNPNTLFTMLEPLLINVQAGEPAVYHFPVTDMRMNIMRKSFIAAEKAELPFENKLKGYVSDYVLGDILGSYDFNVAVGELKYFRKHNIPLDERIDYINNAFSKQELSGAFF